MLRIIELMHDDDFSEVPSNVDLWIAKHKNAVKKCFYTYKENVYPKLDDFDMLIIHGGEQHLWNKEEDPWLYNEITFVKKAIKDGKIVVGFCLGSQIIAEACGGKVFCNEKKETGFYLIKPTEEGEKHFLLQGLEKEFQMFEWHSDHYTLPEHFLSLAYTEGVPNQMIVSKKFPVVGYQFHPEFTLEIIDQFIAENDEETWHINNSPISNLEFRTFISSKNNTYELFEVLLNNVLQYFANEFPELSLLLK